MPSPRDPRMPAVLLAALLCASCAAVTPSATPPLALLSDCPQPVVNVQTNGDLVHLIRALRGALSLCNDDKRALREWANDLP